MKCDTVEHSQVAGLLPQQLPKRPSPLPQRDDGSLPGCLGVERCPTPSLPSGDPSSVSEADRFNDVADEVSMLPQEALDILCSFSKSQFFFKDNLSFQFPGGLDLFSGRCGVAMQMISFGCPWVLTFDYEGGPGQDLLDESLRKKLVRLIQLRAVASFGAAPICSSFSIAITPPIRSAAHPRGIRGLRASMRKKVHSGWRIPTVVGGGVKGDGDVTEIREVLIYFGAVSAGSVRSGARPLALQPLQLWRALLCGASVVTSVTYPFEECILQRGYPGRWQLSHTLVVSAGLSLQHCV